MKTNYMINYEKLEELATEGVISVTEMLDLFVNWHGLASLSDEFMEFVEEEIGY